MVFGSSNLKGKPGKSIAVRVFPVNYLVWLLLATFVSAFVLYLGHFLWAGILLGVSWTCIPYLAFFDRITFDGHRLTRTGLLPRLWARAAGLRDRLKLSDIELVQTGVLRTLRRGENVFFTYRTSFHGKGRSFHINSAHGNYKALVAAVLPRVSDSLLDRRSVELRDHLADRVEVRRRARDASIPPADILEHGLKDIFRKNVTAKGEADPANTEKAARLHELANALRVSGLLPQSIEAFRRASVLRPGNARLMYDFALCLRSYAITSRDQVARRKALALMRLAERRAGDDAALLTDIGEGYFQFGEWGRAGSAFKKAIERAGERFRSLIGLAEVALHEGKIAHVIHNFAAAGEIAETPAARRRARHEIEYFSRLNSDEEYLELEISRINLLDTFTSIKGSALRIAIVGFPIIIIGILSGEFIIANLGWALSLISFAVWATVLLMAQMLAARIPYHAVDGDR